MPYQYGMQNSPAGGNGLGGLPKRQKTPERSNFTRIVTAGSGTIVPPANAKYMRVAVIGGGGGAGFESSGGGGGCAASKIVPVSPIAYTVGLGGAISTTGGNSTATFPGYFLTAFGGSGAGTGSVLGGGASGGDYRFTGGSGSAVPDSSGGGAAGPNGNGSAASGSTSHTSMIFAGTGWGPGGGGGGAVDSIGGSGTGVPAGAVPAQTNAMVGPWGRQGVVATRAGGEMGGGGGKNDSVVSYGVGGVGGIVVEWFY